MDIKIKKQMKHDCAQTMLLPLIIHIISSVIQSAVNILTAGIAGNFAQAVFYNNMLYAKKNLFQLFICLFLLIVLIPVIDYISNYFMLRNSLKHDQKIFCSALNKEYSSFINIDSGEFQFKLESDPTTYRYLWMQTLTNLVTVIIIMPLSLFVIASINVWICILTLLLTFLRLFLPLMIRNRETKYEKEQCEYQELLRNTESDITIRPVIIKLLGSQAAFKNKFDHIFSNYYNETLKHKIPFQIFTENITTIMKVSSNVVILIVGSILLSKNKIMVNQIVVILAYLNIFEDLFSKLIFNIRKYPFMNSLLERISFFYTEKEKTDGMELDSPLSEISIKQLNFSFEGKKIISDFTLQMESKDKVLVCGSNGSGKSTLIKILTCLYNEYFGTIYINGVNLKKYKISSWRNYISTAMQDSYIFEGSVLDNITLFSESANKKDLIDIMDHLGIHHLIDRRIDDLSVPLSGGEKQKIALARALLYHKPILILDEPTNALDDASICWLKEYMIQSNQCIILVTHDNRLMDCANKEICF